MSEQYVNLADILVDDDASRYLASLNSDERREIHTFASNGLPEAKRRLSRNESRVIVDSLPLVQIGTSNGPV